MSTSQFLLPVHLIEEVLRAQEEVIDFAALFVSLRGVVHTQLGLLREELADVGHGEDDLLHGAVQAHDLSNKHRLHSSLKPFSLYIKITLYSQLKHQGRN